MIQKNQKGLKI